VSAEVELQMLEGSEFQTVQAVCIDIVSFFNSIKVRWAQL